jgi:MFS family permease
LWYQRRSGYQLGVLNTPLAAVASDLGFAVETHGAAVVSALLLGGIVGALAAGMAADAIGPKRAMLLNNLLLAAGCAASFWSPGGFAGLFAARVVTGLAVCLLSFPFSGH